MNIKSSFVVACISVLASVVSAEVVSFRFSAPVTDTGSKWDDSLITGVVSFDTSAIGNGPTDIGETDASIEVVAFGQTFTIADELDRAPIGVLTIVPAVLTPSAQDEFALTFIVGETGGVNPTQIDAAEIAQFEINIPPTPLGSAEYPAFVDVWTQEVGASIDVDISIVDSAPWISWTFENTDAVAVIVERLDPVTWIWTQVAEIASDVNSWADREYTGLAALYRVSSIAE